MLKGVCYIMKTLTNSEILTILAASCKNCHKTSCPVHWLARGSSQKSLSTRLNMERGNKSDGIVGTLEKCTILDPKAHGDLTL